MCVHELADDLAAMPGDGTLVDDDVLRDGEPVPLEHVIGDEALGVADLDAALEAGAEFIVSPGLTNSLAKAAIAAEVPFLPGTATSSATPPWARPSAPRPAANYPSSSTSPPNT